MQKALLKALLTPWKILEEAQNSYDHTLVLQLQEEIKTLPWMEVWNYYLNKQGVLLENEWFSEVRKYEEEVLRGR